MHLLFVCTWSIHNAASGVKCENNRGAVPILFGTQFAWFDGSYRKVREKAIVIGIVGYAGWQQVRIKVTDGKRGG